MGFAEGKDGGGSIKELHRKGLIEPAGKIGRRIRWKLVGDKLNQSHIDLMSSLMKNTSLPADQEALIVQLLGEAKDLSVFLSESIGLKGFHYFLQSLFLVLRQMGYFFTEKSSPFILYSSTLTDAEKDILLKIKDIRDAIAHKESSKNYLNANIKIIGGMNFKNGDVEIQYGSIKLYLIGEIFDLHKKLRKLFASADELVFLRRGYGWQQDEKELQEVEASLKEKLKDPQALLNKQFHKF